MTPYPKQRLFGYDCLECYPLNNCTFTFTEMQLFPSKLLRGILQKMFSLSAAVISSIWCCEDNIPILIRVLLRQSFDSPDLRYKKKKALFNSPRSGEALHCFPITSPTTILWTLQRVTLVIERFTSRATYVHILLNSKSGCASQKNA